MRVLLATDIFGQTSHVAEIASRLLHMGHLAEIMSPYDRARTFADEAEAYTAFLREGDVAVYAEGLRERLGAITGPLICVGFSAGAAALWRALAVPGAEGVAVAILFYGGQIRHAVEMQPRCETLLVFPAEEPHFSVAELIARLQGRSHLRSATVPWLHGYMNRLSVNFDQEGYERSLAWLEQALEQPGRGGIFRSLLTPM